jgi:single-stranded DNA-binding protein
MHVNVCTLVGRVSPAGPKLSYASSGTPICSLVVEIDEFGPGEKVFTTWLPVRITGKYAEQSSVDLEPGDIVMVSGKLKYESTMDVKTQQKTSKLIVSSWGIQQRESAHAGVDHEPTSESTAPILRRGSLKSTTRLLGALESVPIRNPRSKGVSKIEASTVDPSTV